MPWCFPLLLQKMSSAGIEGLWELILVPLHFLVPFASTVGVTVLGTPLISSVHIF